MEMNKQLEPSGIVHNNSKQIKSLGSAQGVRHYSVVESEGVRLSH